jgi:large subunit ribosomal protein L23
VSDAKAAKPPIISKERMYQTILSPLITEKATALSERTRWCSRCDRRHQAGDQGGGGGLFNVKVLAVNTMVVKGKTKRFRGREGQRSDWKKAMVRLAEGQSIDLTTGLA